MIKNEKGPKNYTMKQLCPAHHFNTTEALSFKRDSNYVLHTTQSITSYDKITPSIVTLHYKSTISTHGVSVLP